ncbi:MAG: hypothetical protein V3S00_03640 [Dehalococcoidia bacterium]
MRNGASPRGGAGVGVGDGVPPTIGDSVVAGLGVALGLGVTVGAAVEGVGVGGWFTLAAFPLSEDSKLMRPTATISTPARNVTAPTEISARLLRIPLI